MDSLRTAAVLFLICLLSACGGGSSSPSSSDTSPITVTFTATSLSITADTSTGDLEDDTIGVTVANDPTSGVWTRLTPSGPAIVSGSVVWLATGQGKLHLVAQPAGTLGAGTYTSTVKVEVCSDSQCANQVRGSPVNIAVTYVVTGSITPTTQVYWTESFLQGAELTTSETRSPTMTLHISVNRLPYNGLYLWHTASTNGVITSAIFVQPTFSSQVGVAFAQFTVSLKPPAALGSGVFTDSMHFRACFDAACTQVVPESDYTLSFNLVVPATENVEFTRRTLALPNGATSLVWSPTNQSLYVASSLYAPNGGVIPGIDPQIVQVNPLTMATGTTATLPGENLGDMAVATDGSYLYVSSKIKSFLHRLQLPSMTLDLSIPLGNASEFHPNAVNDIEMIPGQPRSFIAALASSDYDLGIYVYDDATPRHDFIAPVQGFEQHRWLVPADTAGTFLTQSYGPSFPQINTLDHVVLSATGINVSSSTPMASNFIFGELQRVGTKLFTDNGRILDASNGAWLGTLSFPNAFGMGSLLVDETHGRIFALVTPSDRTYILSYDLATLQLLALAPIYGALDSPRTGGGKMVLWGNDGVALVDGTRLIVLSGAFFTTYRGEPTLTITTPTT